MNYLPLFFNLKQQSVLIVGGGDVALRKADLLTRAGAIVTAVAPEFDAELVTLLQRHHGQCVTAEFAPEHLDQQRLVIAATDSDEINREVYAAAQARRIPANVVDCPDLCDFVFPSIVDRSPIVIGISSGGRSPVLARLLRARLESIIPTGYSDLGDLAGRFRDAVKAKFRTINQRRHFWEHTLQGRVAENVFAGRMEDAEKLMQQELDQAEGQTTGEIYLVGGGPGDPELLTFKALRLMQQADVVLYDALVSEAVLDLCRRDADKIYVGKKRDNHAVPQEGINQLLIDHAKQGKRVLRLKGGDPFIFGRGGEELERLKEEGIPFQVVPGITAASACSTYAGIPLTHRNYAQSVKFITGQLKNRTSDLKFDELVAPNQTLVFYMGLHTIEHLFAKLIEHGKPANTPAAIVSQGTSRQQQVLTGTLETLPALQQEAQLPAPALIIVGEVVELHDSLSWFGENFATEGLNQIQSPTA